MRTTIDLPDDLHRAARALAHDRHQSLSATIADLVRRGIQAPTTSATNAGSRPTHRDGFPLFYSDRVITAEDVRALDDEE